MGSDSSVFVPRFLDPERMKYLNDTVYQKTGCFLFWLIPRAEDFGPAPKDGGADAYRYYLMNLFKVYQDYGRYAFWFCIQNQNLPCTADDLVAKQKVRVAEHFEFVCKTARHVLSHGLFQTVKNLNPKTIALQNIFQARIKKDYPENDQDWERISTWIAREAETCFEWIEKWAEAWSKETDENIRKLQSRLYYGRWSFNTDRGVCVDEDKKEDYIEADGNPMVYLDNAIGKNKTTFAQMFKETIFVEFKDYVFAANNLPIRSRYQGINGRSCWSSAQRDNFLPTLFYDINFRGVEKARKALNDGIGKGVECPGVFEEYLSGLSDAMLKLPTRQSPGANNRFAGNRFRR